MKLTHEQRAELKALADAATPGPWRLRINRHPNTDGTKWGWLDTNDAGNQRPPEGVSVTWSQGRRSESNAEFIAACRKYIPALLADLEEVESALEAARQEERADSFIAGFLCAGGETEEAKSQAKQFVKCCAPENKTSLEEINDLQYRLKEEQEFVEDLFYNMMQLADALYTKGYEDGRGEKNYDPRGCEEWESFVNKGRTK